MTDQSRVWTLCLVVQVGAILSGCDQLGLETPAKSAERATAESRAIGSACRHAMRAIEDCYVLNPKAEKSSVFGGWKEMDEYMRENKLEGVAPVVPRPPVGASKPKKASSDAEDEEQDGASSDGASAASASGASKAAHQPAKIASKSH
jgi:hypothetical protein